MAHVLDHPGSDRSGSARPTLRRRARACGAALLVFAVGGCGGSGNAPPTVAPPGSNVIVNAYAALESDDYAALPGVIEALDARLEAEPDDGTIAFYAGAMHLWRLTRLRTDLQGNARQAAEDVSDTLRLLDRAHTLRPRSEHAAAFLGIARLAISGLARDETGIEQGRQVLRDAMPLHPAYVSGVRAIALGALPRTHPGFAEAIEAIGENFAACGLSGSGDLGLSVTYPEGRQTSARRVCNDEGVVAHVWEGIFLTFGDVLVKGGDAARGRALYLNARAAPGYASWTLRDLLEERIAQADERAALYLDDNPDNDPPTWMEEDRICVGCHVRNDPPEP